MSFFLRAPCLQSIKQSTGIVGLEVIPNGREVLKSFVVKVLNDVKGIPEDAGYRKVVESTYRHRLDIIESTEDTAAIEAKIGVGQIEELVAQAKDELSLIPQMAEWKPWVMPEGHKIEIVEEGVAPPKEA